MSMDTDLSHRSDMESELTERERRILDAVIRTYVETAEPAGSRAVADRSDLGVSPATVRTAMGELEAKGYLFHPHTSAGRVPTDLAYRYFVDRLMAPVQVSREERKILAEALDPGGGAAIERLVRRAARALSVLSSELGVAVLPTLQDAVLERIDLLQVSSDKILLVTTIRSGVVRTIFVDLEAEIPPELLANLTVILNERLSGLTLREIRETLPERLRDIEVGEEGETELINIFVQSGNDFFAWPAGDRELQVGPTSLLAAKPEFAGDRVLGLLKLMEQPKLLSSVLGGRERGGGLQVTIGGEHHHDRLSAMTLVTSEYRVGNLTGVIGVIGPTRMPYEKVIALVDYTTSLVNDILR